MSWLVRARCPPAPFHRVSHRAGQDILPWLSVGLRQASYGCLAWQQPRWARARTDVSRMALGKGWGRPAAFYTMAMRPLVFLGRGIFISASTAAGLAIYKLGEINAWIAEHAESYVHSMLVAIADVAQYVSGFSLPSFGRDGWSLFRPKEQQGGSMSPLPPTPLQPRTLPALDAADADSSAGDASNAGSPFQEEFHVFVKRMIEIKQLLKSAGYQDKFKLPSIVVIGSQSSGKSSVLESIVGHEFLPKGTNMVTRRPLELTLIHTPEAVQDYAVFPASGPSPYYDFGAVQRVLTELNLSVPETECVSDSPIELEIYSRHVPDLTLIDLPGYIQVSSRHQPASLRSKISELCDKYIQEPNIILAISAADVDLANSEALKASHVADPAGRRTIGVITKMDLVDPLLGASLLCNRDYPLERGYIGVISKKGVKPSGHGSGGLLSSLTAAGSAVLTESQYFEKYSQHYRQPGAFGVPSLRRSLMGALESSLYMRLTSIHDSVLQELEELDYQFKVQYNDRPISVDEYISHLMSHLKAHFQALSQRLSRKEVRVKIQAALEAKLLAAYEKTFWCADPRPLVSSPFGKTGSMAEAAVGAGGSVAIPFVDAERLAVCVAALTKSNIGRLSCSVVAEEILDQLRSLSHSDPFRHHPQTMSSLVASGEALLKSRLAATTNQIENAVKPFKDGTEFTPAEWAAAREAAIRLMLEKENEAHTALAAIQKEIGLKRLKTAIGIVKRAKAMPKADDGGAFEELAMKSPYLVQRANEAVLLDEKIQMLQSRLLLARSHGCKEPVSMARHQASKAGLWSGLASWIWIPSLFQTSSSLAQPSSLSHAGYPAVAPGRAADSGRDQGVHSTFLSAPCYEADPYSAGSSIVIEHDPCQFKCPEIYLQLLLHRLVSTTVLYLHHELVQNFLTPFPETIASSFTSARLQDTSGASKASASFSSPRLSEWDRARLARFARENPAIELQLALQEKRFNLQRACDSLSFLKMSQPVAGQAAASQSSAYVESS